MQEFALFAVLLKERPYKNPYIADGPRQEFVEPAVATPVRPKALHAGSIRRVAQSRDRRGDRRRYWVAHVQAHQVASAPDHISSEVSLAVEVFR